MIYVLWQKSKTEVSIMDITKLVEQTMDVFVDLDRIVVANVLMDMFEADMIVTAENEEEIFSSFPNARIVQNKGDVKLNAEHYH